MAGHRLLATGFKAVQVTTGKPGKQNYRVQVVGYRLQATGYKAVQLTTGNPGNQS